MADNDTEKLAPPGPPPKTNIDSATVIAGDPKAKAMGEVGVSGLKVFSGYTNEEYLTELIGPKAPKVYRTMADDSIVNAVVTAITLILRAVDWRVEPAEPKEGKETSPEAEKEAEFGQSLLDDMSHSWEDFISEAMSMLIYGWSYHEIVLKRRVGPDETDPSKRSKHDDGRIGIRKLPIRSQDSLLKWDMQDDGGVAGMWQQPPQGGEPLMIPIERALLIRTTSRKNSPEGVSILRSAYRPWYIRRGVEDMEAIGVERELAGLPVVSIPQKYLAPGASSEEKAFALLAQKIARDVKFNQQGGVVIPSETFQDNDGKWSTVKKMSIELLTTGGRRAIETGPIVQRYNRDMARSALADFLTLGDEKGSYALSKDKSELFLRACETYLNQIAAVINRFLFPRIFAYNGIAHELIPVLKPGRVTPVDLAELGAYMQSLAAAGAPLFPNQELSNYLADVAGLPEPPEDIGLMAMPGTMPGAGHIDPNTGLPIQPKIDPKSGLPQHEIDRQKVEDQNAIADRKARFGAKKPGFGKHNPNHDERGRFTTGPKSLAHAMDRARRDMKRRAKETVVVKKPSSRVAGWLKSEAAKTMLSRGLVAGGIGLGLHTVTDFAAVQAAESLTHHLAHFGGMTEGLTISGLSVAIQQAGEHLGMSAHRAQKAVLRGLDRMLGTKLGKAIDDIENDDPDVIAYLQELRDAIDELSDEELAGVEKRGSGEFPFEFAKFNPNHDERGRFDFATMSFVSPNVGNTDLAQAQRDLDGNRQIQLMRASAEIDENLGLHSDATNAIGVWEDGAESSVLFSSDGDFERVKTAAAMKGFLANQKAVLVFQPGDGDHFMANFKAKGDIDDISHSLLKEGLANHTLVPTKDGAKVYVYGQGQDDLAHAGKAAAARNSQLDVVTGHGQFIGTIKHGSDAAQRADAKQVYSQVIEAGLGAGHGGQNGGAHWQDIQRRWGATLKRLMKAFDESKHPRDEHGRWTISESELEVDHREGPLPHSDTPEKKYLRFGDIPKDEQSTVGRAPNMFAVMTGEAVPGSKLDGVSVLPVTYNAERNLWQIDDSELTEGGYASVGELLANQETHVDGDLIPGTGGRTDPVTGKYTWSPPEYEAKVVDPKNIRPMYLVTGTDTMDLGTDDEPLIKDVKILDKLNVQDVLHEGYFDPDQDLWPTNNPNAFRRKRVTKYNPYHDEHGRFTFSPHGVEARGLAEAARKKKEWIEQSKIQTVDDLYADAESNKEALDTVGNDLQRELDHGLKYKAPGIKGRPRVLEKIEAGRKPAGVTDVVRATFVAPTPESADKAVAGLAKHFPITDEGYKRTDAGYVDRAVNVKFRNGQIGEVLIMNEQMEHAKSPDGAGGHDLYAASRNLPNGNPEKARLEAEQRKIYGAAVANSSQGWKAVFGS